MAALECWSSRPSIDEDMPEQVLMRNEQRSEIVGAENALGATKNQRFENIGGVKDVVQKKWQKLGRNVVGAISTLKNSFTLDAMSRDAAKLRCRRVVWGTVLKNLTQLYPGSQLPEKLISNIRRHFDSLPISYAQAGFDMKDVFLHIRLIEQATEDHLAVMIQEQCSDPDPSGSATMNSPKSNSSSSDEELGLFKITFACNSSISWPSVTGALDTARISFKEIQLFEKKAFTLGIITIQCNQDKCSKTKIENALRAAAKKPKAIKLSFGLCGCEGRESLGQPSTNIGFEEENTRKSGGCSSDDSSSKQFEFNWDCSEEGSVPRLLEMRHLGSSFQIVVDEWQTICSGREDLGKWLANIEDVEFREQITSTFFKGTYKGKKVALRKLRGCEKGSSYEVEFRTDILELMTCGHRNILPFYGICIDETHGMCFIVKLMDGGSLHELIQKSKKLQLRDVLSIAIDIAEGIMFLNDHGIAHRDLNTLNVLLDKQGNAVISDIGMVRPCKVLGEVLEYEMGGYKWLAPEVIAADPETASETPMSNVYSFGMMLWEMLTCQAPYAGYSPVQAAVGIAACGLRPDIPSDCPALLKSLMQRCWNSYPLQRPHFSEILNVLRGLPI